MLSALLLAAATSWQAVTFSLDARDGAATLYASSRGLTYTVNPQKLTFFATPYGSPGRHALAIAATIGPPVPYFTYTGPNAPQGSPITYAMRVTFAPPPGKSGIYELLLRTQPGFAYDNSGASLRYGGFMESSEVLAWWPDVSGGDRALRDARRRFAGHTVYGYGGLGVECGPTSTTVPPTTPVHVANVDRARGTVTILGTGAPALWHAPGDPWFLAIDPLRFYVDKGPIESCASSFDLADWQLSRTLTATAPPGSISTSGIRALRLGMTREQVVWQLGYPSTFGDLASLQHANIWHYPNTGTGAITVTFRDDRVTSLTTPVPMP